MKTAIVYDWADKQGGVERLLQILLKQFPESDFYSSVYNPQTAQWLQGKKVTTSFMQNLPKFIKGNRILSSLLYPYAFESFNFSNYDLVISVTSSFAKGIITKPDTKHVCILLTPTRFLWGVKEAYKKTSLFDGIAAPFLSQLRKWDYIAAQRPDEIYAISQVVADRCKKDYQRDAKVLYPPFDTDYWKKIVPQTTELPKNYYLVVSRLEPYKKISLVVDTFKTSSDACIIVGSGSELSSLKQTASSNITFMPEVNDEKLAYLYSHAKALIMPQEEDFGYTALEALFYNCPVISYKASGAAEIILENKTGIFFEDQTVESLRGGLERFASVPYNVASYKDSILEMFSVSGFQQVVSKFA
jgi:glycosyltransferase involved in cell wall biosynthesis